MPPVLAALRSPAPAIEASGRDESLERELVSLRAQVGMEVAQQKFTSGIRMNLGDIDEEYVPQLRTLAGRMSVYDRMCNDPQVKGHLRSIAMTYSSGVRWKAVGGTARGRELVEANLLRRGPRRYWMATSWNTFTYERLGMLSHGFAPFGVTWSPPIDGRQIIAKLTWLHPRSIDENGWMIGENDEFLGIKRSYTDGLGQRHTMEPIAASDLFLSTWDQRGPNWEGCAFVRPSYRPWLLNEMAEKIDIIDLQNRGVGIPLAKLSGAGGPKERDTLTQILKSLRGGDKSRAFIVLEKDEDVKYLLSEGQAKDASQILAHHRTNITKAFGAEFLDSGNTASGSRASSSAMATGYFINVDGIRVWDQDQVNHGAGDQPGIVERLIERNFGPDEEPPELVGSRVSPTEQLDNVPLMQDSIAKGMIPRNRKHANEAASRLGWPELTQKEWDEALEETTRSSVSVQSPAQGGPGRPDGAGEDDRGRDDVDSRRMRMTEKKTLSGGILPPTRVASWPWLNSMTG